MQQFAFQSGEEALGDGVVQRITDGAHRSDQPGLPEPAAER
jgi:hypothetical protein